MKRLTSLLLCVVLVFSLAVPAFAALEFTYIDAVYSHLSINTTWGIASCTGYVESIDDVPLEVELVLQVYRNDRWEDLYMWTDSDYYHAGAEGSYAIARGYQYRLYVTGYAYNESGRIVESGSAVDYVNFY